MTSTTKERGGSFHELRNRHLPLFDDALHRHNRGWPHRSPEPSGENAPKRRWKNVGIFHFPHHDEDEKEAEARNGGSC